MVNICQCRELAKAVTERFSPSFEVIPERNKYFMVILPGHPARSPKRGKFL
jgi:hypothetical protein